MQKLYGKMKTLFLTIVSVCAMSVLFGCDQPQNSGVQLDAQGNPVQQQAQAQTPAQGDQHMLRDGAIGAAAGYLLGRHMNQPTGVAPTPYGGAGYGSAPVVNHTVINKTVVNKTINKTVIQRPRPSYSSPRSYSSPSRSYSSGRR